VDGSKLQRDKKGLGRSGAAVRAMNIPFKFELGDNRKARHG
jgi:hypothetical protein